MKLPIPRLLLTIFLCGCIALTSCSKDESNGGDNIDPNLNVLEKITDPVFKEYIKVLIRIGSIKAASPDILTYAEARVITDLSFTNTANKQNMTSLEGIEYFTGLEDLRLNYTAVSYVDLSKNVRIKEISFAGCIADTITIISPSVEYISGVTSKNNAVIIKARNLTALRCSDSKMTMLDVSECPFLKDLRCGGCRINRLDVSNNTALTLLWCGGAGNLTCRELDVSKNIKLEFLSCNQGAASISKLYVWWEGGRDHIPPQLQGYDDKLGTRFIVNDKTQIIRK